MTPDQRAEFYRNLYLTGREQYEALVHAVDGLFAVEPATHSGQCDSLLMLPPDARPVRCDKFKGHTPGHRNYTLDQSW